jgi:pyroglutamyl-peptidase
MVKAMKLRFNENNFFNSFHEVINTMRDVVFTSFGPFRDVVHNPSILVAAEAAAVVSAAGGRAGVEHLEVTYLAAERCAQSLGDGPLRIHLGLAASRSRVTVERWGRPESGSEPDNAGSLGPVRAGDALLLASGGAEPLVAALRAEGVMAELSDDAGGFVCNALLWASLASGADSCFVHLPLLDDAEAQEVGRCLGRALCRWLAGEAGV